MDCETLGPVIALSQCEKVVITRAHVTIVMADAFKTAYKRSLTSNDAKHLALPYILVTGKDASKATKTEMVNALTSAMNCESFR
jgi:uncharacterized alpha/beta hydrolase family protein